MESLILGFFVVWTWLFTTVQSMIDRGRGAFLADHTIKQARLGRFFG